jgi:hypothetical protein
MVSARLAVWVVRLPLTLQQVSKLRRREAVPLFCVASGRMLGAKGRKQLRRFQCRIV